MRKIYLLVARGHDNIGLGGRQTRMCLRAFVARHRAEEAIPIFLKDVTSHPWPRGLEPGTCKVEVVEVVLDESLYGEFHPIPFYDVDAAKRASTIDLGGLP